MKKVFVALTVSFLSLPAFAYKYIAYPEVEFRDTTGIYHLRLDTLCHIPETDELKGVVCRYPFGNGCHPNTLDIVKTPRTLPLTDKYHIVETIAVGGVRGVGITEYTIPTCK